MFNKIKRKINIKRYKILKYKDIENIPIYFCNKIKSEDNISFYKNLYEICLGMKVCIIELEENNNYFCKAYIYNNHNEIHKNVDQIVVPYLKELSLLNTVRNIQFEDDLIQSYIDSKGYGIGQKCKVCGCTQACACPGGCYWVEDDLCSKCYEKKKECLINDRF